MNAFGPKVVELAAGEIIDVGEYFLSDLERIDQIRLFVWLERVGPDRKSLFSPSAGLSKEEEETVLGEWRLRSPELAAFLDRNLSQGDFP